MFERYTEGARRVVFFSRYEARNFGSAYIETEHLLLGLLREEKVLIRRLLPNLEYDSVHKDVAVHTKLENEGAKQSPTPLVFASQQGIETSAHVFR